ncbi:hypothetical protein ACKKBG_A04815 [Auxenochlorella protothecoides x Auxenochlorella symbiontica]
MPQQALHRVTGQGSLGTWCLLAGLILSWNPAHARTDPDTVLALQEAGAELACAVPAWNESGDPCSAATCGAAGSPACAWPGVACEAWAVVGLALPSAGCTGTLSPALGQLPGLRRLDLSSNALWGGVPDALGALGALRYLDLGGNALTGTLPAALGRTAIQTLLAGGNALTGRLPPFWAYAGNLARVALAGNALTGTLPADWGRLAALRSLDLGGNALTGTLPPAWLALPRLTLLGLFNNCGICGDLPAHAAPASLHLEAAGTALGQPCSPANCHGGDGAVVHSGRISTQTVVLTSVLTLVAVTGVLPTLAILCLRYVPCAARLRARLGARLGARHADAPPRDGWPLAATPPAAWHTLRLDPRRGSGPGWAAEVKLAPGSAPVRPLVVVLAPDGGVALAEGPGSGVVCAPGEGGKGAEDVAVLGSRRHTPDLEEGWAGAPPGRVTSYLSAGL